MLTTHTTIDDIKALLRSAGSYKYDNKTYHLEGNTSTGSAVISNVKTTNLLVGDEVSGTGIPKFSTIQSIDSDNHTVTIDLNATADGTDVVLKFEQSGQTVMDAKIASLYDAVEYEIMYPIISETTYNYINDEITDLSEYNDTYRLIVLAERYLIAAEFLQAISDAEFENRQTEREFKIQSGVGTSVSGRTGKGYVADKFSKRAYDLLEQSGYSTNYGIPIY